MSTEWKAVVSKKPLRAGEAFILRGDTFVMKIYKDSVTDPFRFARWIAEQMNKLEDKQTAYQAELAEQMRTAQPRNTPTVRDGTITEVDLSHD